MGQVIGVFGPNGCGKSTLLRLLAGLAPASEGKITRDSSGDLRQSVGFAALDLALYPDLTADEHLGLAAKLRGHPSKAEIWLDLIALPPDHPTRYFSSGMRALLRLALAVQHSPTLLLLDEPSASLDEAGRNLVRELIAEQCGRGIVVLATNDPIEKEWAHHAINLG